jgi:Tetracyclin repressor-like, C-terminal domain
VIEPIRTGIRVIFERAIAREEMSRDIDICVAMDMLHGAIWERLLVQPDTQDERFARKLVDVALTGLQSRQA